MKEIVKFFNNIRYAVSFSEGTLQTKKTTEIYENDTKKNKRTILLQNDFFKSLSVLSLLLWLPLGTISLVAFLESIEPVWGLGAGFTIAGILSAGFIAVSIIYAIILEVYNNYFDKHTTKTTVQISSDTLFFKKLQKIKNPDILQQLITNYFEQLNEQELANFVEKVTEFHKISPKINNLNNLLELSNKETVFATDTQKELNSLLDKGLKLQEYFSDVENKIIDQRRVSELMMTHISEADTEPKKNVSELEELKKIVDSMNSNEYEEVEIVQDEIPRTSTY